MKLIKLAVFFCVTVCLLSGCWWHHHAEESHERPHHSDHQEHRS